MGKIIRLIDRTRTVADWKCPRARYWGYEYNGRGIVKGSTGLALVEGIQIHDALAAIAHLTLNEKPIPIESIAEAAGKEVYDSLMAQAEGIVFKESEEFALEQATLVKGLIYGFYRHMWPKLLAMYPKIFCVEQEMEYPLSLTGLDNEAGVDYIFMTKPDLIMETPEGELVYIEYKSTSSKKQGWMDSWETAVQLHSSVKATEFSLGRLPSAVQIVGLYKGYESYGKQSSPFCYAYKKSGNPPFTQDQVQYEYKAGFRRYATWELPGGVKKWVEDMPDEILANQFPLTPQIFVNEDLIARFFKQRLNREQDIEDAVTCLEEAKDDPEETQMYLDHYFPQMFDQCQPSFGWSCQYKKLCHGFVQDPLAEGFIEREPHHGAEREQLGLTDRVDKELS